MTIDMTNNRVPYGLLTDEEKAALHEHEKAGGEFERYAPADLGGWCYTLPEWCDESIYRTVPLPKTQDVIAWDRLPDWAEWVARDKFDDLVSCYENEPHQECNWWAVDMIRARRIDGFPGIVQIGTCDWKDSKQRRPK
jgi:hypothetical protein